jgi:hypothetical protein
VSQSNYRGEWWLPQDDSIKIKGNLELHNNINVLTLQGKGEQFINFDFKKKDFFLIGLLENGIKNTLYIQYIDRWNENFNQDGYNVICVLQIQFIFEDIHITNKNKLDEIEFNNIKVIFTNIDNWFNKYDLMTNDIVIKIKDECNITIAYKDTKSYIIFKIESLKIKTLEHYLGLKYILQGFFNFLTTDKPVLVESFIGELANSSQSTKIKYRSTIDEPMVKVAVKRPFLFRYDDIKNKFELTLNNWFRFYNNKDVILDLYLGAMYNNDLPLSMRFLTVFQSLESYHAACLEHDSPKKQERKYRIEEIEKVIDTIKNNQSVKDYLKFIVNEKNSPSLKERLGEVYDKYESIFPMLTSKVKDKGTFIKTILKYRHTITHASLSYNKLANDDDFFWQIKNLELLLQLCILTQVGFTNEDLSKLYMIEKLRK